MKARVKWIEGVAMLGESGSGHGIVMDGPPDQGGRNIGVRPMEMLLIGLGGCTQFDVLLILRKARQKVTDCVVELTADRAETDPKVFTRIMLGATATITHDFEIRDLDTALASVEPER
jgi:putative redox protein